MNISKITPDDPRLTAYALGELEPGERAAIEAALKDDPVALAAVAQIRALSGELAAALAQEPLPLVVAPRNKTDAPPAREAYPPRKFIRFPYFIIAGLAAACFALMFVHQQRQTAHEQSKLAENKAPTQQQVTAKSAGHSDSVYELDLKPDSEIARVASMPAAKGENAPLAPEPIPAAAPAAQLAEVETPKVVPSPQPAVEIASSAKNNAFIGGDPSAAKPSVTGKLAESAKGTEVAADNEVIVLSPFAVEATRERGYMASNTVAGTRMSTHLSDLGSGLTVARHGAARPSPELAAAKTSAMPSAMAFNTEGYAAQVENNFLDTVGNPLSTFSIDVDTASYANLRRFLNDGQRPPRDAVRIEELVNYFPYHYPAPNDDKPFAASMEVANAPWNPQHRLVRIGLKGREISVADRPALNLVFLLDVSGSMDMPNKLPLVKDSMRLLIEKLKPTDRVAIAVYAGASGLALPSTPAAKKQEILAALDALAPGGSTNGALGIQLAYDIAKANFIEGGANRVVLCTDGDFNVGVTNQGDLTRLIEEKAKSGVFLTVLGFGMGNYKDDTLEKLADKGNGNYGYVDNAAEAKKLLADQLSGTLVTIAKDVKLQVEFNPDKVRSYRLIGYENRLLNKEDFNNDKIDAGEIGAGHTVTALYEVVPVGVDSPDETPAVDPLKYQAKKAAKAAKSNGSSELLTLKIRYKAPDGLVSHKLEFPLVDSGAAFAAASQDFKFAAAVASFGMMLRESPHKGAVTFDSVLGWAEDGLGEDAGGYRHEFMDLVKKAKACSG
jgi:Ca-activated chloride channel family protein